MIMWSVFSSKNLLLPPGLYPSFLQLYANLPESRPSLPEYTPLFNNYNIMRPSQNLPLPPRIYAPFQQLYIFSVVLAVRQEHLPPGQAP